MNLDTVTDIEQPKTRADYSAMLNQFYIEAALKADEEAIAEHEDSAAYEVSTLGISWDKQCADLARAAVEEYGVAVHRLESK
jgi:hypothetical protein